MPLEAAQDIIISSAVTNSPVHIFHLGSTGLWQTKDILKLIDNAKKLGVDVTTEVYPYTAGSVNIGAPHVDLEIFKKFGFTASVVEWIETGERLTREKFIDYKKNRPEGAIAAHIMKDEDVELAIAHPSVLISSDTEPMKDGKGHPRAAGTHARILGHYVREKQLLPLMSAIEKMTLLPAKRLESVSQQMTKKGRLQLGADADITIFDAKTVIDKATYQKANFPSEGIIHVIVNGESVVKDSQLIKEAFPGKGVRRFLTLAND